MYADTMPLDSTFREITPHGTSSFPIQFYIDELYKFTDKCVPLHWHLEPEFFVIKGGNVCIQISNQQLVLHQGDGIFINSNVLHKFTQLNKDDYCQCPNIVFNAGIIAPVNSAIYQKYIKPIILNSTLPYLLLHPQISWQKVILEKLTTIFAILHAYGPEGAYGSLPDMDYGVSNLSGSCYEMQVQNHLNKLWQLLFLHLNDFPKITYNKKELQSQVRLQKMISFIQENYARPVSLQNISQAANISKSEASRCFHTYLNSSPIEYLLNFRIEIAEKALQNSSLSINEICLGCGFHSQSYFTKIFKMKVGVTPGVYRTL
jgi:AraC-like DNA-binding protein